MRLVPVTPGASAASDVKLRPAIGRFWTESVSIVNERSPELAWISRRLAFDVDDFARAADFERQASRGRRADRG